MPFQKLYLDVFIFQIICVYNNNTLNMKFQFKKVDPWTEEADNVVVY